MQNTLKIINIYAIYCSEKWDLRELYCGPKQKLALN